MSDVVPVHDQLGSSACAARERQMLFVEYYLANGHNGTRAAIAAGYAPGSAKVRALRLLGKPWIQDLIAARAAEVAEAAQLNTNEWAKNLAAIAFSNPGDLYDGAGKLIPIEELPEQVRRALVIHRVTKRTMPDGGEEVTTEIKFCDKNQALVTMARHLGLFEKGNTQQPSDLNVTIQLVG